MAREKTRPGRPRRSPAPSAPPRRSCRRSTSSSAAARSPISRRILAAIFVVVGIGQLFRGWSLLYSTAGAIFGAGYTDVHIRLPLTYVTMVVAFLLAAVLVWNIRRAAPVVAGRHRRLDRRPHRAARHRPGRLPVAHREPEPADQGARVHRLQPQGDEGGLPAQRHHPDEPLAQDAADAAEADRQPADAAQHPPVGPQHAGHQLPPAPGAPALLLVPRRRRRPLHGERRRTARPCSRRASSTSTACRRRPRPGSTSTSPTRTASASRCRRSTRSPPTARPTSSSRTSRRRACSGARDHAAAHLLRRARHRLQPGQDQGQGVRLPGAQRRRLRELHRQRRHPHLAVPQPARLLGAFGTIKFFTTSSIESQSRIIIRNKIQPRIRAAAPFLTLDHDPYMVIADGRSYWIQDAYTTTVRYPYSHAAERRQLHPQLGQGRGRRLQRHDEVLRVRPRGPAAQDLRGRSSRRCSRPRTEMPQALLEHVRYPEDLFNVQAEMYSTYHVDDADVLYNKGDQWEIPDNVSMSGPGPHGRLLRDHEAAGRAEGGVPAHAAVRAERPQQHDRLARRALRPARLRQGAQLHLLQEHTVFGPARSRRPSTRTRTSARSARSGGSRARR